MSRVERRKAIWFDLKGKPLWYKVFAMIITIAMIGFVYLWIWDDGTYSNIKDWLMAILLTMLVIEPYIYPQTEPQPESVDNA